MSKTTGMLRRFGFSYLAETIYFRLLSHGCASVSDLAQALKQHRPAIYKALPELLNAKIIRKERDGKRHIYIASSPQVLAAWIKKQMADVEGMLSVITELHERRQYGMAVSTFEGKNGLQTALDDVMGSVPKRGKLLRIEAPEDYQDIKKYYTPKYRERANNRSGDVDKFLITNPDAKGRRRAALNRTSKSIGMKFEHNFVQLIGSDRVAFMDYDREQAFVVQSKHFANYQRDLFKALFNRL